MKLDHIICNDKNFAKCYFKYGINRVASKIILIQDADLEYNPKDYYKLSKLIKKI